MFSDLQNKAATLEGKKSEFFNFEMASRHCIAKSRNFQDFQRNFLLRKVKISSKLKTSTPATKREKTVHSCTQVGRKYYGKGEERESEFWLQIHACVVATLGASHPPRCKRKMDAFKNIENCFPLQVR